MLDISISDHMSLPVYSSLVLTIPALLTWGIERIKLSDIKNEFINGNKKSIMICGGVWGLMMVSLLIIKKDYICKPNNYCGTTY